MTRRHQTRRQPRPAVPCWRVTYGNEERVGRGIVLSLRIAGSMRIQAGMRLHVCLWQNHYPKAMIEAEGRVQWTRGPQFDLVLPTLQTPMR